MELLLADNGVGIEIVDDPHIAVHIQSYPDRLFGNINVIINLFILKNRYPVKEGK